MGQAFDAPWDAAMWILLCVAFAASIACYARKVAPPLWVTLAVALALRLVVVAISHTHTPDDITGFFRDVGNLVLQGRDPLTVMPRYSWNFLPAMDYVLALELKTGLEWSLASKVAPISADLITVFLIGLLVDRERAANTRLLYALSPLALLVTAFHGQVEPVSVALGLGALVLARQHKPGWAGVALGCAIATKTWPVLFAPGVLREIPIHRWWRCLLTTGSALMAFFLSTRIVLGGGLHNALHVITSYRSWTGEYGWGGVLHQLGVVPATGYSGPGIDTVQRVGAVLLVLMVATFIVLFRRVDGVDLTSVIMLGFLAVTAGFGPQYLLWGVPLVYARRLPRGWPFLAASTLFAAFVYLVLLQVPSEVKITEAVPVHVWGSLLVIATSLWAIPWGSAVLPFGNRSLGRTPKPVSGTA